MILQVANVKVRCGKKRFTVYVNDEVAGGAASSEDYKSCLDFVAASHPEDETVYNAIQEIKMLLNIHETYDLL